MNREFNDETGVLWENSIIKIVNIEPHFGVEMIAWQQTIASLVLRGMPNVLC